jgi:hypothetical protein
MSLSAQNLNAKFLRSFYFGGSLSANQGVILILKLIYEFWGFCLNGGNSLTQPGGMASSQVTGSYLSQATGFESGSNVLLASGSDGVTSAGLPYFTTVTTAPFSTASVGKWLVLWKSGSTSTDDSIYPITKFLGSGSVVVDPTYGGTSVGANGSVPQFTSRTNINYRVVDFYEVTQLSGYNDGQYMVIQFNGASTLNPGQAASQAQFIYKPTNVAGGEGPAADFSAVGITLSPSGSWDGNSTFVSESYQSFIGDGNSGPGSAGHGGGDWFDDGDATEINITLIGGPTFLIGQWGGREAFGSCFQIEIPRRLYPQANDPNPICGFSMSANGIFTNAQVGYGYAFRWFPSPYDSPAGPRRWPILMRCYTGAYWSYFPWDTGSVEGGQIGVVSLFNNPITSKFLSTDGILGQGGVNGQSSVAGQYSLCRAQVLSTRWTSDRFPKFMRIGDGADRWIHVNGGVLWPWDHAIVTRPLFVGF